MCDKAFTQDTPTPCRPPDTFVGTFVELTSGMQYGHYNFQCGFLFLFVIVYRDTTSVVLYGDGVVLVNGDFDVVAIAGKCLVDELSTTSYTKW